MKYKTILVTGGAGFIGSNLAVSFKKKYPKVKVIALDNLKRRGSELNLCRLKERGVRFAHGDIRNPEDLDLGAKFDLLLECSAEPSVMESYINPQYVVNTNLVGTVNCLELARKNNADVVFLSTSRVYPYEAINRIKTVEQKTRFDWRPGQKICGWSKSGIDIDFTLDGPKSLYGATKLCSEILLKEYIDAFGIKGVINRCGVIGGPWQFGKVDQGIFTYWMLAYYFKKSLKFIGFGGRGKQVRDLLHVDDLFALLDLEISSLAKISGSTYNVGGGRNNSLSLIETTRLCEEITGNHISIKNDPSTRPGDVNIYISDNSKVKEELGWRPQRDASEVLIDIYSWVRENETQLKKAL